MPNKTLVSIVTVSYNQIQFLEEAILSVLGQDYEDIEYILYDGGSTDGSLEVIERYRHRIKFVSIGPDGGPAAALNAGFRRSSGAILAYLNSDDVLLPGTVSRWVRELENSSADIVYGDIDIIDEYGNPTTMVGKSVSTFLAGPISTRLLAAEATFAPQQATAWKRRVYDIVGGFEESNKTCWDGEFFADAALKGMRFKRVSDILAKFRVHSSSISGTNKHQAAREFDHARIKAKFGRAGIVLTALQSKVMRLYVKIYRAMRYLKRFCLSIAR